MKTKWPRSEALAVAREMCERLKPCCEKLIVAGSLRRLKQEVGDVEIVYITRWEERPLDMFAKQQVNLAEEEIGRMLEEGILEKRLSKTGTPAWGDRNKLATHHSGIPVDLFRTVPEAWWNYLVCRTGPADSNTRIASEAQRRGYRWNPYGSGYTKLDGGTVTAMGSEAEVFEFVGMAYVPPSERR